MVGDLSDILFRLRSVLPKRWFSDDSPNLNALLGCFATPWVWFYELIGYVRTQSRILTATDVWLDLVARDYLGKGLSRNAGESDPAFRARIINALLCSTATRAAIVSGIKQLTGHNPGVFEPANCGDTGCYGAVTAGALLAPTALAYGITGGWGNLQLPYQVFLTVQRPSGYDEAGLAGYGTAAGGYGAGSAAYLDLAEVPGQITDQDIQTTISRLLPVNTTAWLRIT